MARSLSEIYNRLLYQSRLLYRTRLAIFLYHGIVRSPLKIYHPCFIDESIFRSQVEYLERHFNILPFSEAVERLKSGGIHRPTAVITFDDGFQNNYDLAFPILHKAGRPAAIFPVTGLVNTKDTTWFCRFNHALTETSKAFLEWNGCRFDLSEPARKAEAFFVIKDRLKEFAQPQLLGELRRIILKLVDDPDSPIQPDSPFRILGQEAIGKMAGSGLIEFGAHTDSHAILSLLSEVERRKEIERSLAAIREWTGHPCKFFAYPNGCAQDYDLGVIKILESHGLRAAVTAIWGPNDKTTPVMELRRYAIDAGMSIDKFKRKVRSIIMQDLVDH